MPKTTHMRTFASDKIAIAKMMREQKIKTFPEMIRKIVQNYKKKRK